MFQKLLWKFDLVFFSEAIPSGVDKVCCRAPRVEWWVKVDKVACACFSQRLPVVARSDPRLRVVQGSAGSAKLIFVADCRVPIPSNWHVECPTSVYPIKSVVAGLVKRNESCGRF